MMSVSLKKPSVMAGSTSADSPETVSSPVCQPPTSTSVPRPKAGSHFSSTENR